MKNLLGAFVSLIAVAVLLSSTGCSSSTDTVTVIQHDTVYSHYWDMESANTTSNLIGVAFRDLQNGAAVGVGGTLVLTSNRGETWSAQQVGNSQDLYGISFGSTTTGVVVGSGGVSFRTLDGGHSWSAVNIDANVQWRAVQMVTPTVGYAAGSGYRAVDNTTGYIYKTVDGGQTWSQQAVTAPGLYGLSFVDTAHGWACGFDGAIVYTSNGGSTWTKQTSNVPVSEEVASVSFADVNHGIAVGLDGVAGVAGTPTAGFIATTNDGGASWTRVAAGPLTSVKMSDVNHAVACGYNGIVMETSDGGAHWSTKTVGTERLLGVYLNDANNGAIVGDNGRVLMLRQ